MKIATAKMMTKDGRIEGKVRWNPMWKKFQVYIDGSLYGEYNKIEDGIGELEGAGFKNIKVTNESTNKNNAILSNKEKQLVKEYAKKLVMNRLVEAVDVSKIKVGTKIEANKQVMVITSETSKYFKGYIEYKGKKHEVFLSKSTLTNPHYKDGITIIDEN